MNETATIRSLPQAFAVIKQMDLRGWEWSEEYRAASRWGLKTFIEHRMNDYMAFYFEDFEKRASGDRYNGTYQRHLLTEMGNIEVSVPRSRYHSAAGLLQAFARRSPTVDQVILASFLFGVSTRKVAKVLMPLLGETVSATTVSRVAKSLDEAVKAFHRRRLVDQYRVLAFDGVVMSRKTGAGAIRRPVLVALGIRPDGRKEVIDFSLAPAESSEAWETFLNDLHRRGLFGAKVDLIAVDGGPGLKAALDVVYPYIPIQRCWAHKTRNILDKVKQADREAVKRGLHRISHAANIVEARKQAGRFAKAWENLYPKAVKCLRDDLDELLSFFCFDDLVWRKAARTTNAIERRFVEVRRRTRPMGVFSDRTSVERILFAVFMNENRTQGTGAPFSVTHNN